MKRSIRLLVPMLSAAAILFLSGQWRAERVLLVADGQVVGMTQMIHEIRGSRFIFIGENHDLMDHHRSQLKVIEGLSGKGIPLAIGLEMFTSGSQEVLDRWVAGKTAPDDFVRSYYREWPMPWPLYRDIFLFARNRGIPLIGLNVPREISRKVSREGFAALTPAERRKLPKDVTCSIDPVYRAFIRRAFTAHDRGEGTFEHFCEAQMLWNTSMAIHLLEYSARHPETTLVVLAGVGHAMKQGIPEEVFRRSGKSCRVILPEVPRLDRNSVTFRDADYLLLSGS